MGKPRCNFAFVSFQDTRKDQDSKEKKDDKKEDKKTKGKDKAKEKDKLKSEESEKDRYRPIELTKLCDVNNVMATRNPTVRVPIGEVKSSRSRRKIGLIARVARRMRRTGH